MEYRGSARSEGLPGPARLLFALAAVLLLFESRRPRPRPRRQCRRVDPAQPGAVAGVAVVTALFFALLEPLGYLIAFTIYLFLVMLWLHGKVAASPAWWSRCCSRSAATRCSPRPSGVSLAKGLLYF